MLLKDAKSKQQVAEALESGDQELRDDVDAFLEAGRDSFLSSNDRYGEDQDPFGFSDLGTNVALDVLVDNEEFRAAVREHSPIPDDVPDEVVQQEINKHVGNKPDALAGRRGLRTWGPFAVTSDSDPHGPSLVWSYRLDSNSYVRFEIYTHFENPDLCQLIPEDEAREFWSDLARSIHLQGGWQESNSVIDDNYGYAEGGTSWFVGSNDEEEWSEFCRDIIRDYFNAIVLDEPKKAMKMFLSRMEGSQAYIKEIARKAESNPSFPDEEDMDYVVNMMPSDHITDEEVADFATHMVSKYLPAEETLEKFKAEVREFLSQPSPLFNKKHLFSVEEFDALMNGELLAPSLGDHGKLVIEGDLLDVLKEWYSYRLDAVKSLAAYIKRDKFNKNPTEGIATLLRDMKEALIKSDPNEPKLAEARFEVIRKAFEEQHFSKKNIVDMAYEWVEDKHGNRQDELYEQLLEYADAILAGATEPELGTVLAISKEDLQKVGITSGVLFEEGPLKLVRLRAVDLADEGRRMRHCVGDSPIYARGIRSGTTEIWSLRDRKDRPMFTLEVSGKKARGNRPVKGSDIRQLKGKANRTPGYDSSHSGKVSKPSEVMLWRFIFKKLGINPAEVRDFGGHKHLPADAEDSTSELQAHAEVALWRLSAKIEDTARQVPKPVSSILDDVAFILR